MENLIDSGFVYLDGHDWMVHVWVPFSDDPDDEEHMVLNLGSSDLDQIELIAAALVI